MRTEESSACIWSWFHESRGLPGFGLVKGSLLLIKFRLRPLPIFTSPSPAVLAGPPDRPVPFDSAVDDDLLPAVKSTAEVVVLVLQVLDDQLEAADHRGGGVVGVDLGHAVVAAQGAVTGGVVDCATVFVPRVVPLRSLVHQGGRVKAFRRVVEPASRVAEGSSASASTASRLLLVVIVQILVIETARPPSADRRLNFIRRCETCDFCDFLML